MPEKQQQVFSAIEKKCYFCNRNAGIAQLVEHDLAKVDVAGSSPVSRSKKPAQAGFFYNFAALKSGRPRWWNW
jgi:hypothetical protein